MAPLLPPDVLVLAAGGVMGEAWMTGVLGGLQEAADLDFGRTEQLIGTSAGSIVAASLAGGRPLRRPRTSPSGDPVAPGASGSPLGALGRRAFGVAAGLTAPLAAPALALGAPGGARLRAFALARVPGTERSLAPLIAEADRRGARWDGRLRVVAVDRGSGRRVVFGAPGGPRARVGEAVAASCSVPGIFAPIRIGGRDYVDGGAWSLTNLDVADVGRGTEVLCLNVSASLAVARGSVLGALRAATRAQQAVEEQVLRRRGARVRSIGPDAASAEALGPNLMAQDGARADAVLAAGWRQGVAVARRARR